MKVPNTYQSSNFYTGGVDVVYDDASKLQYAPFIYAGTQTGESSDSGDSDGGDELVEVPGGN